MNKTVIFLFIATGILILSIISISVAPIINNTLGMFGQWGKSNCRYYADKAKYAEDLDTKYKNEKNRNLCYRQNGMYVLEYTSFIIDLGIGFVCGQLALMHYFKMGSSFEKYTGLIGLIGGAIGFILTLIYVCFSGYIFNNDTAFKSVDEDYSKSIKKLYPNGGEYKLSGKIYVYTNDKNYDSEYIKYKELGDPQYNYNSKIFEAYYRDSQNSQNCVSLSNLDSNCEYYYFEPYSNSQNKYLYDRWCLSLVFAVFIVVLNGCLLIFGFLSFKDGNGSSNNEQTVKIE